MHFDLIALIKSLGYLGVWGIVFAESGIVFCFFFPGDSLLFTAGFLASQDIFDIFILTGGCFAAAVTGNMLGYEVGRRIGLKLFARGDTRFFKLKHLTMTQRFYAQHGGKAIILARFMPIIRTFAPFMAGMAQMDYKRFTLYNLIGAAVWAIGLCVFGYAFGQILPADQVDKYLLPIIGAIIVLSLLPSFFHVLKERRLARAEEPHA